MLIRKQVHLKLHPCIKTRKQQELRPHVRPRLIKDPKSIKQIIGSVPSAKKVSTQTVGFIVSVNKYLKHSFIDRATVIGKKAWFYRSGF